MKFEIIIFTRVIRQLCFRINKILFTLWTRWFLVVRSNSRNGNSSGFGQMSFASGPSQIQKRRQRFQSEYKTVQLLNNWFNYVVLISFFDDVAGDIEGRRSQRSGQRMGSDIFRICRPSMWNVNLMLCSHG